MTKSRNAIIITPVKDSIDTTLETIRSVQAGNEDCRYIVYNDFSTPQNELELKNKSAEYHFELINLSDLTQKPSPNYDVILIDAQQKALQAESHLIIIESDVSIRKNTLNNLVEFAAQNNKTGLVGAVTVDEKGDVNFPYLKFRNNQEATIQTKRSLSFCCTLLTYDFLKQFSFSDLDPVKDWYDVTISKISRHLGFENVLLKNTPVLHRPHSSRAWKQLKYTNPVKYYFYKWIKRRDKI